MRTKKITDEKKSLSDIVNISEKVTFDVVDAKDYKEKIITAYNRIYYISEGSMQLILKNQEILLQKGDACFVEKGTSLELKGTFQVIIVGQVPVRL